MERKTVKRKQFTIEEKNEIVLLYLDGHIGVSEFKRKYNITSDEQLYLWIRQYKKYGTCVDGRGKATGISKGRPRTRKLTELSREELIRRLELYEDIKKCLACLAKQNRNTK